MKLFVEHLTTIDSAYLHPEHGLVGESWMVDITLDGGLDSQSMVMDFADVKKSLKNAIDDSIDHTLIVPKRASHLTILSPSPYPSPASGRGKCATHTGEGVTLRWKFGTNEWLEHASPSEAVTLLDAADVTNEAIITHLQQILKPHLPASVKRVEITLRHEITDDPTYHYVHGLKKHDGNCQRIAHGHRSRIQILRDGKRAPELESAWAQDWKTAYIGTREDIVREEKGVTYFAYQSNQGDFHLTYPTARCRMIDTDSTVECIATHIAQTLKKQDASASFAVRAYEGVQKGAIAEA